MSQTRQRGLVGGGNPGPDVYRNQPQSTSNQPLQGEFHYGDSSWPIYLMYSKIAEQEDNRTAERCQKYTDGTLIFSGLFSATVGALLTVSIPDLKPNPQDTSAFYLENIYQVLGNSNVSQSSISSTLAKPPAFSPPSYAIWVNSLWFLSLAVSLSSAMGATMIQKWAVDYIDITQWPWDTLVKRARIRAIFSQGNPGPGIIWGTNDTHAYLHLSLLLFIAGDLIYLFNINHSTFYAVISWVGFMAFQYTSATVSRVFNPHDLFHTPLSSLALRIYLGFFYVVFQICSYTPPLHGFRYNIGRRYHDLNNRYSTGILIGKRRAAQEIASKPSSDIDDRILERILPTLDEDHALETFFDAIPGFCNSKLCVLPLSFRVQRKLQHALDGFLNLTFSSNSVSGLVRASRLITCLNAAHAALGHYDVSRILDNIFDGHWDDALQSIEIGHALRLWNHSRDHDRNVRRIVACIVARVRERDDRWTLLVKETFGVPDHVFRDYLAHGDSVLLSILIHVSRQANCTGPFPSEILSSLSKFDIRNTLPQLQHDFCKLWNEISQEARNQRLFRTPGKILIEIRHLYIALHQNAHHTHTPSTSTDPALFSTSTDSLDFILDHPWSYSSCNIASHRPDPTTHDPVAISDTAPILTQPGDPPDVSPHQFTLKYDTALRLAEETNIITGLPSPPNTSMTSEIGETSHAFTATFPNHSNSPSPYRSLPDDLATAQPDTTADKLSNSLERNRQQGQALGLAAPYVPPSADNSGTLSIVSTPAPLPASTLIVPNKSFTTHDASPAFITESLLPVSSGGFSGSDSLSPPPVPGPPSSDIELLPLRSGVSPKDPSDYTTPPRIYPGRLVDNGNMCLVNAVLQLLVHCPPFRDLFRNLGRFVGQRKRRGTGGDATPLMDTTVRFLDELACKGSTVAHQLLEQIGRSNVGEDKKGKFEDGNVHLFSPTYIYDAMEKRRFIAMRGDLQHDAAVFLGIYLEALDEEIVSLRSSISTHRPASAPKVDEFEEDTQTAEGHTEMGERDYMTSSVDSESAISRIFDGRSRLIERPPNQPDIVTIEDWRLLKLNIRPNSVHTIQDALAHILQPQPVQEIGEYCLGEASQQVQIEVLPSILVLHLERFLYDAASDGVNKVSKFVQFAPELDIPLVGSEIVAPVARKSAELAHYKLYGVLYHHGESAGSRHYTVDVLHQNGDSMGGEVWLRIDDEAVSAVRHEDVFRGHDNERGDDRCAYMLFYCRVASDGPKT